MWSHSPVPPGPAALVSSAALGTGGSGGVCRNTHSTDITITSHHDIITQARTPPPDSHPNSDFLRLSSALLLSSSSCSTSKRWDSRVSSSCCRRRLWNTHTRYIFTIFRDLKSLFPEPLFKAHLRVSEFELLHLLAQELGSLFLLLFPPLLLLLHPLQRLPSAPLVLVLNTPSLLRGRLLHLGVKETLI